MDSLSIAANRQLAKTAVISIRRVANMGPLLLDRLETAV
jgi:hypothetical protein